MKHLCLVVLALGMGARLASAQQAEPVAQEPRASRAGEVRFGVVTQALQRQSGMVGLGTAEASGTLSGFELFARMEGLGILGRRSTGTMVGTGHGLAGDYLSQELRLMLGGRIFSIEGGLLERTGSHLNEETTTTTWRGGVRSQWGIGGSGVVVTVGAGMLFSKLDTQGGTQFKSRGHDLDAQFLLQAPRDLPLYLLAGWHHERFDDLEATAERSEEASGPYLGIGVRWAPKPILR